MVYYGDWQQFRAHMQNTLGVCGQLQHVLFVIILSNERNVLTYCDSMMLDSMALDVPKLIQLFGNASFPLHFLNSLNLKYRKDSVKTMYA